MYYLYNIENENIVCKNETIIDFGGEWGTEKYKWIESKNDVDITDAVYSNDEIKVLK